MKNSALQWLKKWEDLINQLDFENSRPLFSRNVVSFGTLARAMNGLDELESLQWRKIWPTIEDFRFDNPAVLISEGQPDLAIVVTLWSSKGKVKDGSWYARRGRATLVLKKEADGLRCIHSHFSMEPGIPPLLD